MDIECLARLLVGQANIPTVGAAVQSVPEEMRAAFRCSVEAGMG